MVKTITESRPKNPSNTENFDKPMGRRAKNAATRIAQVNRVVRKYGIDRRAYDDPSRMQALKDYKRALENSLGVSVKISTRGDDGEYSIRISYEDNTVISGYIRLTDGGDGTYTSSLILWPKAEQAMTESRKTIHLSESALRKLVNAAIENL